MAIAELIMPKMGESIMEATILRWHKKVGDHIRLDETLLDIATDKVDSEIPSPVEGIVTELLYPVNAVVPVGSIIAKFETNVSGYASAPQPAPSFQPAPPQQPPAPVYEPAPQPYIVPMPTPTYTYQEDIPYQPPYENASKTNNNRFFSPLVLNIANSEGISLSELERIPGTGADGRVSKKDVLQYVTDKKTGKAPAYTPSQPAPQVVYVQQPVQEYQPPYTPSIPTPVQEVVMQKASIDTPVYIAPQPIVDAPVIYPQPIVEPIIAQSIVEAPVYSPAPQPVYAPATPVVEQFAPQNIIQPVVEAPVSQQIAQPIVAPQPIGAGASVAPQAIVQPIAEFPAVQPLAETIVAPQPVGANASVAPQAIEQPVVEAPPAPQLIAQPIIAPETGTETPIPQQPIMQTVTETKAPETIVEPIIAPQPIVETPVQQPIVEATPAPIVETVAAPAPIVETKPVEESIAPQPIKYAETPHTCIEVPKNLKPVYMVPPVTPTVPLVTLAEGESGKYTTPASAHPSGNVEIIEMDRMRKMIAKHMVESVQTSPHVTSFTEADVTNMVFWRERVKQDFEKREGTKLTFTPMFIDCLVKVLKRYPLINSSVEGDKIIIKKDLNIGMATALPTGNLIVPVIKGADQLNIVGLSAAVNKLGADARSNQLKPDDVTGGTFTFTNVGTFGTLMGTPIINQPQVAILAVGIIKKRPVVIESPNNDTIGIRHMMYLSLSYDHRVIDGSVGASFLSDVAKEFENWDLNRTWYHYL
ncbi:2-oxo acid dehydrogenase subunit E2 [Parasediminibacterium sp. JCM 36343]|uniref:2-oxo acid dehydrogenase subunit E2 n=1 Tax=Parasediminibacterium sp. JCM 36343 TaxID=3374279 RepID=UPI00397815C7